MRVLNKTGVRVVAFYGTCVRCIHKVKREQTTKVDKMTKVDTMVKVINR